MQKVGAFLVILVLAFASFVTPPAAAFGLRIGPFHLGMPSFGHRHHHRPLYMHGNTNDVAAREVDTQRRRSLVTGREDTARGSVSLALFYPARALPAIFQNVFWPAFSSPWPFAYDSIFTTAFAAKAAVRSGEDCPQSLDAGAMVERIRAEIGPNAEQMERLQRLGGSIGAAADYLSKSCPAEIPVQPTARLQLMDSQIQILTMAADMIRQPLQEFEQSLTDEQRARFNGDASGRNTTGRRASSRSDEAERPACGSARTAIDWSIGEIDKSVQPTAQQRSALSDVQQAFGRAASDLQAHCPTMVPRSAVARLETIEARLDATWRAILSMQVALQDFESQLSDEQKSRLQAITFASR